MKIIQSMLGKLPEGTYTVAPGLYLRVRGKYRNFFVRLQVNGKRREVGIGSASTTTIAAAKQHAEALRVEASMKKEDWGRRVATPQIPLFGEYAEPAFKTLVETRKWKNGVTESFYRQILRDYVTPVLKDKRIDEITRDDVLRILKPLWYEKPEVAKRSRRLIEILLDLSAIEGYTDKRNPAAWRGNLEFFLPSLKKVHKAKHLNAPTFEDAQSITDAYLTSPYITHKAIVFGILTAARRSEFVFAQWKEVDLENAVWSVPPERRKDQKPYPHRVPLSKQAVYLLKSIPIVSDYVFSSPINANRPISTGVVLETLRNFFMKPVTMHGCRSTFSDWGAREGIDSVLIEKSLMHATGNKVAQAYQRDDLLERRRPVMQAWADALFKGSGLAFD